MVQITKEMVLAMHEDLIRTGGQIHGILCEGTIDYIVGEINFVPGVYMTTFEPGALAVCDDS